MRFARLDDWLGWLETLHPRAIDLGLGRVAEVAERAGLRRVDFPLITVGGTNGKGSVCALLENALAESGYLTGCYTSPHLYRFNERVRLARNEVGDDELMTALDWVDQHRGDTTLSYFEFTTLAAMRLFQQMDVDVAVLEVGLGGRLDAVNLWDAEVAVITSVGVDHIDWLGDTREQIAVEKAGIARACRPLICGDPLPPMTLYRVADEVGAQLLVAGRDFSSRRRADDCWDFSGTRRHFSQLPAPGMGGEWQYDNAATALEALDHFSLPVNEAAIRAALIEWSLPGRFERQLRNGVELVFDVAHNPQAVVALSEALGERADGGRTFAVAGFMADKAVGEVLATLSGQIDGWYLGELPGSRAMPMAALAELIALYSDAPAERHANAGDALSAALSAAAPGDRVLVFGSFVTVAEARRALV